jgi:predicted ribosomally synthesized peptide with nif11-like leader
VFDMSAENLKKFMDFIETDEVAAKKVEEIGGHNIDGLIAYGKELGIELSEKDFDELKSTLLNEENELSDDTLDEVSGGFLFRKRKK